MIRFLVKEFGADVKCKDVEGVTPLHFATELSDIGLINVLVKELGANVGAKAGQGLTPLYRAQAHFEAAGALAKKRKGRHGVSCYSCRLSSVCNTL